VLLIDNRSPQGLRMHLFPSTQTENRFRIHIPHCMHYRQKTDSVTEPLKVITFAFLIFILQGQKRVLFG